MHFSTALTTLAAFALMSTNVAAVPSATFDTWDVTTCNGRGEPPFLNHYQRVEDNRCADLPNARSIKVYNTRNANCKINTFSERGCSGTLESYKFEDFNAPCRVITGKVSYNVTC